MTEARRASPVRATMRRLLHHRLFLLGCVLFGIVLLVAILAPVIAPLDPNKLSMRNKFLPPGRDYIFGTDNLFGSYLARLKLLGSKLTFFLVYQNNVVLSC